jgi:hypothetical protein
MFNCITPTLTHDLLELIALMSVHVLWNML